VHNVSQWPNLRHLNTHTQLERRGWQVRQAELQRRCQYLWVTTTTTATTIIIIISANNKTSSFTSIMYSLDRMMMIVFEIKANESSQIDTENSVKMTSQRHWSYDQEIESSTPSRAAIKQSLHGWVTTLCPKKNIPDIFDSNLKTNYQIFIIFGTNIPDTTCHQTTTQFPT